MYNRNLLFKFMNGLQKFIVTMEILLEENNTLN